MNPYPPASTPPPLTRLGLALLQAGALWGLHQSILKGFWPATASGWLLPAYLVSVLLPLTLLVLAEHWRTRTLWIVAALLTGVCVLAGHNIAAGVRIGVDGVDVVRVVVGASVRELGCRLEQDAVLAVVPCRG